MVFKKSGSSDSSNSPRFGGSNSPIGSARAEITYAANGRRASCVMLNKGKHIVEVVSMLDTILQDQAVAKSSDLVLMVLDASKSEGHRQILTKELEAVGLRLNKKPPQSWMQKMVHQSCSSLTEATRLRFQILLGTKTSLESLQV